MRRGALEGEGLQAVRRLERLCALGGSCGTGCPSTAASASLGLGAGRTEVPRRVNRDPPAFASMPGELPAAVVPSRVAVGSDEPEQATPLKACPR